MPTNQLNNIKCLEKGSKVRNSDLLMICHQNKHQNHNTPHKEEPETKSSFNHPLKEVVVQSICSLIHKSLTPLNYSDKADCTTTKTLVFSDILHHQICDAFVKLHACNYGYYMAYSLQLNLYLNIPYLKN